MKDRISANPGRVLVTPENGGAAYYATLTRADNPTQEGTALNKANLLTDETAALFGLSANAVPNDVLALAWSLINKNATDIANGVKIEIGSYTGTGAYGSNNPNNLTFGFRPKLLVIIRNGDTASQGCIVVCNAAQTASFFWSNYVYNASNSNVDAYFSYTDTGVEWYSTKSENAQLNYSGTSYHYVAIS